MLRRIAYAEDWGKTTAGFLALIFIRINVSV
jgi:hypothetical protein